MVEKMNFKGKIEYSTYLGEPSPAHVAHFASLLGENIPLDLARQLLVKARAELQGKLDAKKLEGGFLNTSEIPEA